MEQIFIYITIALILILFICLFWETVKKLLINSLVGIILIVILNLVFHVDIPLNLYTIAAAALFGLPAVGTLLILYLGKMP